VYSAGTVRRNAENAISISAWSDRPHPPPARSPRRARVARPNLRKALPNDVLFPTLLPYDATRGSQPVKNAFNALLC